ncbi:MAG TPA: hypothetical protein VMP03_05315 [Methylomirabilota bacterium]|nr:hypothetical protein [Methylomirabilota bacterium]
MLTGVEISRSTYAAIAPFRGDPQGLRRLDVSYDGFWRSFQVIFLLLPVIAVLILSERAFLIRHLPLIEETFPSGLFLASRLFGAALDWIAFPVVLALLARPLDLGRRYVPIVVALNWAALVAAVPAVVPHLLSLLGLIGEETAAVLNLVALGVILRYEYMVIRIAVGAPPAFCIGLVALDFLISVALSTIMTAIVGI